MDNILGSKTISLGLDDYNKSFISKQYMQIGKEDANDFTKIKLYLHSLLSIYNTIFHTIIKRAKLNDEIPEVINEINKLQIQINDLKKYQIDICDKLEKLNGKRKTIYFSDTTFSELTEIDKEIDELLSKIRYSDKQFIMLYKESDKQRSTITNLEQITSEFRKYLAEMEDLISKLEGKNLNILNFFDDDNVKEEYITGLSRLIENRDFRNIYINYFFDYIQKAGLLIKECYDNSKELIENVGSDLSVPQSIINKYYRFKYLKWLIDDIAYPILTKNITLYSKVEYSPNVVKAFESEMKYYYAVCDFISRIGLQDRELTSRQASLLLQYGNNKVKEYDNDKSGTNNSLYMSNVAFFVSKIKDVVAQVPLSFINYDTSDIPLSDNLTMKNI